MNNPSVWDRFDSIATADEVLEAKVQFEPMPAGDYEAVLEEIEPSESKTGLPMLKGKFRTPNNRVIFYNQMLQNLNNPSMTAVNISEAVKFVEGLTGEAYSFTGLSAFAQYVINELPVRGKYILEISYGTKDIEMKFPKLKVKEILEHGVTPEPF